MDTCSSVIVCIVIVVLFPIVRQCARYVAYGSWLQQEAFDLLLNSCGRAFVMKLGPSQLRFRGTMEQDRVIVVAGVLL